MIECEYKQFCASLVCPEDPLDCRTYEYWCEHLDELDEKMGDGGKPSKHGEMLINDLKNKMVIL